MTPHGMLRGPLGPVYFLAVWLVLLGLSTISSGQTPAGVEKVRKALKDIAAGRGAIEPLVVTYDDLHNLWGGLRLTIRGTGKVEQTAVRERTGERKKVLRQDLVKLVGLLVKHAAWEQRVPERAPVPDESRAYLTIQYGKGSVKIWEWHNDLEQNRRIAEIRDFMKQIAWRKSAKESTGSSLPPEIHRVTSGVITAHFGREELEGDPGENPILIVESLWFTFTGDETVYVFEGTERLFGNFNFDLFSPDGAHVVLLQGYWGPFDVVATDKLKGY